MNSCKISWSWIHMLHFMTYEFRYVFIYMKNIVKSYMKSAVPPLAQEWPGQCLGWVLYRDRQWSDMTKTAYVHSYCCILATRSKKCISVPFVWHQGWYIKFTVAPSQIGDQGWLRRRAALGGQGPRPASPPTVRRRLYRKVWIIMTMIGKSGSKIVLELNHPRCKAAGQQEELEIRIQSA